jgi:hypothetical protein
VEGKIEAEVLKQQRLEGKRQQKAFEQAVIESPIGGIFEAQAAAEPGESASFKTMSSLTGASVVGVLKPEFFYCCAWYENRGLSTSTPTEGQGGEGLCA